MGPPGPERLPIWMQTEVGYALWWLNNPERGPNTGPDIIERLLARGYVRNREEARQILRRARADITATARIRSASTGQSLNAACGYRCPPDTPIALRIRIDVLGPDNRLVQNRSIVINARAGDNLRFVLDRARDEFNARYTRGTMSISGQLHLPRQIDTADIEQVLIGYTEGSATA